MHVYYDCESAGNGIKYMDCTPRPAYDSVPFTHDIPVAGLPSWCKRPYIEGAKLVCDWLVHSPAP